MIERFVDNTQFPHISAHTAVLILGCGLWRRGRGARRAIASPKKFWLSENCWKIFVQKCKIWA